MEYRLFEQVGHMGVVEGVDDAAAAPLTHHQPEMPEDAQLV